MPLLFASLIILAPLYVWRFSIGGLPTNFLMVANFVVIAVGLVMVLRNRGPEDGITRQEKLKQSLLSLGWPLLISIGVFGLASLISLFVFGANGEKLAQWVVLYAQPLLIFALIRFFVSKQIETNSQSEEDANLWLKNFRIAAYVIVGAAGALAVIQYFTLLTLPPQWWGNAAEPKRAIAFFAHANAFGLFVTPLLAWLIPDVVRKLSARHIIYGLLWALGAVGIFLSLSRGAWLGLAAAIVVYALVAANKKVIIGFVVAGIVVAGVVAAVPNLRYRVLLPFYGEKSSVARLSLWETGVGMIKDSPVLGKGINGFSDNWDQYNTDKGLEHYNFPHNIFLNFWVDLGLLGVLSMVAILLLAAARGFARRKSNVAALGMLLFIVAMVVHGLIDIPYLKNDLALVFWIVLALGL